MRSSATARRDWAARNTNFGGSGPRSRRARAFACRVATATRCGTLFNRDYPNWQFALNVSYPIGGNAAEAQAARTRLLIQQNQAQIRATELTVATEVTNAALQVTNNAEALAAARVARELSQRRLDAEMSRFEVGMSNNYQVVQMHSATCAKRRIPNCARCSIIGRPSSSSTACSKRARARRGPRFFYA